MIKFDKVMRRYDHNSHDYTALNNINLTINNGEFVSLVGPSGAGKTTLMKMLTREETPTSGSVFIDDIELSNIPDKDVPKLRRNIGMIYQDFKLLDNMNAFENVAYALEVTGASESDIKEDVPQLLEIVGLQGKAENFPDQLSGGEQQRLAIARALIHRPRIILADEPTGNLDSVNSFDVVKLLWKINELGTTIILATHDREIVNTVGRRVITLESGKVVRDQVKEGRYVI